MDSIWIVGCCMGKEHSFKCFGENAKAAAAWAKEQLEQGFAQQVFVWDLMSNRTIQRV